MAAGLPGGATAVVPGSHRTPAGPKDTLGSKVLTAATPHLTRLPQHLRTTFYPRQPPARCCLRAEPLVCARVLCALSGCSVQFTGGGFVPSPRPADGDGLPMAAMPNHLPLALPAGVTFLIDQAIWHCALPNTSEHPRRNVIMGIGTAGKGQTPDAGPPFAGCSHGCLGHSHIAHCKRTDRSNPARLIHRLLAD